MADEIWKAVFGYEGLYEVSNYGRVRSLDRIVEQINNGTACKRLYKGKILKLKKENNGYLRAHLSKDGVAKSVAVHRIVAMAFCPNPDNKPAVNHLDCNPVNNSATNLEWVTYKENMQWASSLGRMHFNPENLKKACQSKKKAIIATNRNGETMRFPSITDAIKQLGLSDAIRRHISSVCKGLYGYKTAGGYYWNYE